MALQITLHIQLSFTANVTRYAREVIAAVSLLQVMICYPWNSVRGSQYTFITTYFWLECLWAVKGRSTSQQCIHTIQYVITIQGLWL